MGIPRDIATFFRSLRSRGLPGTLRLTRDSLQLRLDLWRDRRYDRRHAIDTCGITELADLTIDSRNAPDGVRYQPIPVSVGRRILARLPDVKDFVFVDFGSGKGRTLFLASEYPFARIVGVEFAQELHEAAVRNIATYRNARRRCSDIRAVHGDAAEFQIPDGPCVFYFYAPFRDPVMSRVLGRIEASYDASPRKVYLVYANPFFRGLFDGLSFVRRREERRSWFRRLLPGQVEVLVYESVD